MFVVVYDGQHALRFTLGRARAVVGPGVHFKIPIIQQFRVKDTRHTTLDLEPQVIQLSDELVYEVDCKVVYQIVNLRKALIEIDDLVTGLQNRVVIAVQKVLRAQTRVSIRDTEATCDLIRRELAPVEEQWGVRVLQFGFSNISPSPATLEITQLELFASEKLRLFEEYRRQGLSDEAAVALIAGAVVALDGADRGAAGATPRPRAGDAKDAADEIRRSARERERAESRQRRAEEGQSLFDEPAGTEPDAAQSDEDDDAKPSSR